MKNTTYLLLVTCMLLFASCEKHWTYDFEDIEYGFNSEIHRYSKEVVLMKVNDYTTDIQLKGTIEIYSGGVEIKVIQPNGESVFEKNITENSKIELNKIFPARKGYWKLVLYWPLKSSDINID